MDGAAWAQIAGSVLASLVALGRMITAVQDFFGGPPALRILKEQLDEQNKQVASLIDHLKDQNATLRRLE